METFYDVSIKRENEEALIQSFAEYDQVKLYRGEFTPMEPFDMEIDEGSRLYDIVGFQDTSNFAISERLYSLLKESQVSGWTAYEIRFNGVAEKYYGLQVVGRCGKLHLSRKPGFYTGYKFDYGSWDKSDLFSPDETVLLFCTEKVKDLLKSNNITNVELTDISKAETYSVGSRVAWRYR